MLDASDWGLVIVDEAHRMSANWWAGESDTTRRYELGQRLGPITRHLPDQAGIVRSSCRDD
jgi:hypothetical protein